MINNEVEFREKVRRYSELHAIVDKYSKEMDKIKGELKPYMQQNEIKKITHEGKDLELVAQDRSKVDSDKLLAVLKKRLEHFKLDVYKVVKEFDNALANVLFYKDGEDVVRVEVNGEVFNDLDDARQFLIENYGFTEEQAQDTFSGVVKMEDFEKDKFITSIKECIITKEVPNEEAVKEAVSLGSLTMSDIAEATIVAITYALMLKKPKGKPKK